MPLLHHIIGSRSRAEPNFSPFVCFCSNVWRLKLGQSCFFSLNDDDFSKKSLHFSVNSKRNKEIATLKKPKQSSSSSLLYQFINYFSLSF